MESGSLGVSQQGEIRIWPLLEQKIPVRKTCDLQKWRPSRAFGWWANWIHVDFQIHALTGRRTVDEARCFSHEKKSSDILDPWMIECLLTFQRLSLGTSAKKVTTFSSIPDVLRWFVASRYWELIVLHRQGHRESIGHQVCWTWNEYAK